MKNEKKQRKKSSRVSKRERKQKIIFGLICGGLLAGCTACAVLFRNNISWIPFAAGALLAGIGLANALWKVINRGVLPVLAFLCAVLAVVGQLNYVTVDGHTYSTLVQTLDVSGDGLTDITGIERCRYLQNVNVSGLGLTDVSALALTRNLEKIDMRDNPVSEEQYLLVREAHPQADILWSAPLGQIRMDSDSASIALGADGYVTTDMLIRQLGYFADMTYLDLTAVSGLTAEDIARVETEYPDVTVVWTAPAGSGSYATDAAELTLTGFDSTENLLEQLAWFRDLTDLDITACETDPAQVKTIEQGLPGVDISWKIVYKEVEITHDDTSVDLEDVAIADILELSEILALLSELTDVNLQGTGIVNMDVYALISQFPDVQFAYTLDLFGVPVSSDDTQISLSSVSVDDESVLSDALDHLPNLTYLDLGLCALPSETLKGIRDSYENLELVWTMNVSGFAIRTDAEEISFNGAYVADLTALDDALEYMPDVTRIDLCGCGHSDDALGRFQDEHPDIKVVWVVNLGRWQVRTDATAFSTLDGTTNKMRMSSANFMPLKYCTEMQALDLGHQQIDDISFLAHMPDLRILILADNQIRDISVLSNLTKLEYAELFMNQIHDVSPLSSCPNLLDLNLCYNYVEDVTPIAGLSKLERLWITGNGLSGTTQTYLRNALPGCECNFTADGSTDDGWREHSRYDTLFDIFNVTKEYREWD